MDLKQGIFHLKGIVQHYSWGGFDFIPEFLGYTNTDKKPFAEYWLGAHPNFPAKVTNGSTFNLNEFIASDPYRILGENVVNEFGSLPYLFKILDVRQMLSIQVHPDKQSARREFEEENKKGIALNAANRNYKDKNHKPELMVALSDFWLLHGFKKSEKLVFILQSVPELSFLKGIFENKGYKGLYEHIMNLDQKEVHTILDPLLQRIIPLYKKNELTKDKEDFWAARAALTFCKGNIIDRGIFSIYLFNLVHLKEGEGVFQPEGMPHAYLEGQNVEVMANSDNVLRAGLTDKHVDAKELMKHVAFKETIPKIINPDPYKIHRIFASPALEFELHQYQMPKGHIQNITTLTGEIWLLFDGSVSIKNNKNATQIRKGEAIFVLAGNTIEILSDQYSRLYRVSIPELSKN